MTKRTAALPGEVPAQLDGMPDYEIVVADDGSAGNTPGLLQDSRDRRPRPWVLRHNRRSGRSAAIASGVSATCPLQVRCTATFGGRHHRHAGRLP
jgi:Glycosyl transferase family 2